MVKMSDSEWRVMSALWDRPQTITELTATLAESTGWSKHTILTFLRRMEEKGAVRYEQGPRAKRYYPCVDRQDAQVEEATEFLDRCFSGRIGLMVNTMLGREKLSREEIEELGRGGRFYDLSAKSFGRLYDKYRDRLVYSIPYDEGYSKKPVPVGIDVSDSILLKDYQIYENSCVFSIGFMSRNIEACETFLDWILEGKAGPVDKEIREAETEAVR